MGRDFRINEIESTYKPVSYCMYKALQISEYFKDDEYSCTIKPKELASVIIQLDGILDDVEELPDKFVNEFKFYDNETEKDVREHIEEAKEKFKDALIWAVLYEQKYLSATYL